jgi:hypothetical protein
VPDALHKRLLFDPKLRDHARAAFLILVSFEIFVLPALVESGALSPILFGVVPSFTLLAGVIAVGERRSYGLAAGSIAVLSLAARFVRLGLPVRETVILDTALTMLAASTLFVLLLVYVFRPGRATVHRLIGAVVAYLLLAVIWARAFELLRVFHPRALDLPENRGDLSDLIYFSFATLTTLGYGTPMGPIARSMCAVEALVGQLYPAILIARLVSASSPAPERARD